MASKANMTCEVEPFPSKLRLNKILSITTIFVVGNHAQKMNTWINNKFKTGGFKSLKIGIAIDPESRAKGYKSGDVMVPIFMGNRNKCDKMEKNLINGLGMQYNSSQLSNRIGGGGGPSWGEKRICLLSF
jgi:hypothetical protein